MSLDVIIIGLGAMGSAAAYHLAKSGARVLGLDRFAPPHAFGSSHGESRIIREAYFEHPLYVPLVQHAYELWRELEQETGEKLFLQTGGLMIGPAEGALVQGALLSARTHHLQYDVLDAAALHRDYPVFHLAADTVAVREPRAGILFPEKCIAAHLRRAQAHGADLRFSEPVFSWQQKGETFEVKTGHGSYDAPRLAFTAGAWLANLLAELGLPLKSARQALFWFDSAAPEKFDPRHFPIFIFEHEPERYFYGFPDLGNGLKIAIHHEGEAATPETLQREIRAHEEQPVRDLLHRYLPAAAGALRQAAVCLYTNTPDSHFLIDFHPASSRILLASPCSGHGFKFSSAIGELIAQSLLGRQTRFDLAPFRLQRFAQIKLLIVLP